MLHSKDLNFSFSGLKTAVVNYVKNNPKYDKAELAYEFQEAVVEVLVEKTQQAVLSIKNQVLSKNKKPIIHTSKYILQSIILTGGVSANKRLREAFAERFGDKLVVSPLELTGDNAGMIGLAAWWRLNQSIKNYELSIKGTKKKNHNTYFMLHNTITRQYPWQNVDVDPSLEL